MISQKDVEDAEAACRELADQQPAPGEAQGGNNFSDRELAIMRERDYWERRWKLQADLCDTQEKLLKLNREYPGIVQSKVNDLARLLMTIPESDGSVAKALAWVAAKAGYPKGNHGR